MSWNRKPAIIFLSILLLQIASCRFRNDPVVYLNTPDPAPFLVDKSIKGFQLRILHADPGKGQVYRNYLVESFRDLKAEKLKSKHKHAHDIVDESGKLIALPGDLEGDESDNGESDRSSDGVYPMMEVAIVTDYAETDETADTLDSEALKGELAVQNLKRVSILTEVKATINFVDANLNFENEKRKYYQAFQQVYYGDESIQARPARDVQEDRLVRLALEKLARSFNGEEYPGQVFERINIRLIPGNWADSWNYGKWLTPGFGQQNFAYRELKTLRFDPGVNPYETEGVESYLEKGIRIAQGGNFDGAMAAWYAVLLEPEGKWDFWVDEIFHINKAAAHFNIGLIKLMHDRFFDAADSFSKANRIYAQYPTLKQWYFKSRVSRIIADKKITSEEKKTLDRLIDADQLVSTYEQKQLDELKEKISKKEIEFEGGDIDERSPVEDGEVAEVVDEYQVRHDRYAQAWGDAMQAWRENYQPKVVTKRKKKKYTQYTYDRGPSSLKNLMLKGESLFGVEKFDEIMRNYWKKGPGYRRIPGAVEPELEPLVEGVEEYESSDGESPDGADETEVEYESGEDVDSKVEETSSFGSAADADETEVEYTSETSEDLDL